MSTASPSPFFRVGPDVLTFLEGRGLREQFNEAVVIARPLVLSCGNR